MKSSLAFTFLAAISTVSATAVPLKLDFDIHKGKSLTSVPDRTQKRGGNALLSVANDVSMYVATLEVGSQRDKVSVVIDTGSSDLWCMSSDVECLVQPIVESRSLLEDAADEKLVIGTAPGDIAEVNTCTTYGSFSTEGSTSFTPNITAPEFAIEYVDTTGAQGIWGQDSVSFGGVTVVNVSMGVANESNTNIGTLGLGLMGIEETAESLNGYVYDNFPVLLKKQGIINKIAFSLYLNDIDATSGSVLFGAIDHAKYSGELKSLPLINPILDPQYTVFLDSIQMVDDHNITTVFTNQPYVAVFDTGTSLTVVPESIYDAIVNYVGGAVYSPAEQAHEITCPSDTNKTVEFTFSGFTFKVPLSAFIFTDNSTPATSGKCYLGFTNGQASPLVVLGDNFLRNGYFVFDLEEYTVSIAQAKYTNDEDIEVIGAPKSSSSFSSSSAASSITASSHASNTATNSSSAAPPSITESSSSLTTSTFTPAGSSTLSSVDSVYSSSSLHTSVGSVSSSSSLQASLGWSNSSSIYSSTKFGGPSTPPDSLTSELPKATNTHFIPGETSKATSNSTSGIASERSDSPVEAMSTVTDVNEETVTVPCPKCQHSLTSFVISKTTSSAMPSGPESGSPESAFIESGSSSSELASSGGFGSPFDSSSISSRPLAITGSFIAHSSTSVVEASSASEAIAPAKGTPSVPQENGANNHLRYPVPTILITAVTGAMLFILFI